MLKFFDGFITGALVCALVIAPILREVREERDTLKTDLNAVIAHDKATMGVLVVTKTLADLQDEISNLEMKDGQIDREAHIWKESQRLRSFSCNAADSTKKAGSCFKDMQRETDANSATYKAKQNNLLDKLYVLTEKIYLQVDLLKQTTSQAVEAEKALSPEARELLGLKNDGK
jgi:hypothetical protein